MRTTGRWLCMAVSGLALAGCAPAMGSGLYLGASPSGGGLSFGASTCSPLGQSSSAAARFSRMTPILAITQRMQSIQAQYTLGYSDVRAREARWKRAATGEC